jgi:hypothetical protein
MKVYDSNTLDLSVTSSTFRMQVLGGPISIQPIIENLVGLPTYSLEVSNDKQNANTGSFACFSRITTNLNIEDLIQIADGQVPWEYIRLTVTTVSGASGNVSFKVSQ